MESRKRSSRARKTKLKSESKARRENIISDLKKQRLYNSDEVCEILDISLQSLRRAIALNKIKTVRLGRFLRIPANEINKLLKGESTFLSVAEAAELLNVSVQTIRAHIKQGKIKAFRLANKGPWKIAKSDVERIYQEGISQ